MTHHRSSVGGLIVGVLLASSASVVAQNAPATSTDELVEIIVTAQKRSERLRDVPMSISAATGDQLKQQGITNAEQLDKLVPGFTFQRTVYGLPVFFLRGIGFNDTTLGVSPGVSVYVDQQPLPFSAMTRGAMLDLERVEVLKGPQGTLFGQNSTGGAINYIAAKPTDDLQVGAEASFGRFNALTGEAFISGTLAPTLTGRLAVRGERQDDWQRGYTNGESIGQRRFINGRATLDWEATDAIRAELVLSGWRDKSDTQQPQTVAYTPLVTGPAARPVPFPLATFPTGSDNPRAAAWDPGVDFARDDRLYQIAGRIDADLTEDISLSSLSAYAHYRQSIPLDLDGTTYPSGRSDDRGRVRTFSQELRLNGTAGEGVRWMVGANYQDDSVFERLELNPLITSGTTVGPVVFDELFVDNDQEIKSKGVFGSLDVPLADSLVLQGSVRYTDQDRDFGGCVRDTGNGQISAALGLLGTLISGQPQTVPLGGCGTLGPAGAPLPLVTGTLNEDNLSWRGSLNWNVDGNSLIYANVTKGYKSGSFPTLPASSSVQFTPVPQESVLAFEAGTKLSFGRALQVEAAAFYSRYDDKQLVGFLVDPVFGPLPSLVSIPKNHIQGGEVTATLRPVDGLVIAASGTYVDTRVDRNPINPTGPFGTPADFVGQRFPYTPRWQGSLDTQYNFPAFDGFDGFIGGTLTARSGTTGTLLSGDPAVAALEDKLKIGGYALIDLRAGIEADDARWRLELWGRNITNRFYVGGVSRNSDFTTRFAGAPATYGVTLRYRFQ
ncbi:TonB-dependent receptor [Niveispirillum sp.]|uniref:TonB-dependent receptor n=1 Tax=Niveispirillum sp. TaxID=1917217 RepID=UPI001B6A8974|nr:TonB-dependent receptor [Niveispirillum sp.]MBP7337924.1 TonB-dependent receptor [Niveispirillum sp.]